MRLGTAKLDMRKMVVILSTFLLFFSPLLTEAQRLQVSDNRRFLVTEDGAPFFWLGDTAWELFHRCDREEADFYLQTRAEQGFNVIHAVALAEIDGLRDPNPYGEIPLVDMDPAQPNPAYFENVDYVLQRADALGLYVALLPTWGDKVFTNRWGVGPEIFDQAKAETFGYWIGSRYGSYDNIIWVIGGDRNPREDHDDAEIWRALAAGINRACGGPDSTLMTFHPQPRKDGGSSTWFHTDEWLDFNMHQTGHCANKGTYTHIQHDYALQPVKPVLDGEPLYEDHPNCFNARELGHSVPRDIRRIIYWNVFAGAFGQSYGCHAVWQMYDQERAPINQPLRPWSQALELPMALQMQHLKHLMLSRPFLTRIPDQSIVVAQDQDPLRYIAATRDEAGSYACVYFPFGQDAMLNLASLEGDRFRTWWFDPRTGTAWPDVHLNKAAEVQVTPPSSGPGQDWVLVIDAEDNAYPPPGTKL